MPHLDLNWARVLMNYRAGAALIANTQTNIKGGNLYEDL